MPVKSHLLCDTQLQFQNVSTCRIHAMNISPFLVWVVLPFQALDWSWIVPSTCLSNSLTICQLWIALVEMLPEFLLKETFFSLFSQKQIQLFRIIICNSGKHSTVSTHALWLCIQLCKGWFQLEKNQCYVCRRQWFLLRNTKMKTVIISMWKSYSLTTVEFPEEIYKLTHLFVAGFIFHIKITNLTIFNVQMNLCIIGIRYIYIKIPSMQ